MKVIRKKVTPAEIIKEVQKAMIEKGELETNKDFNLYTFCQVYKHQTEDLPWKVVDSLFKYLQKNKYNVNYLEFTLPEKERLKGWASDENSLQANNNPGLATVVKFLMEDKQITQLEERVLFWINKKIPNDLIKNNAKEKIINGNKKILFYFIKKLKFKLDHDEGQMLTEGYIELRKMFDKYKPETNWKFLSYAQYSIYQVMKKDICTEQNLIYIPLNVLNQIYKLNQYLEEHGNEQQEADQIRQWQKANRISNKAIELLKDYRKSFGKVSSIDTVINSKGARNSTFESVIAESNSVNPDTFNKTEEMINTMDEILSKEELDIVRKAFGIGCEKWKRKDIVKAYPDYSISEINTILKTGVEKLKKNKEKLKYLIED